MSDGKVLFVSQNPIDRCENLRAVWDAYDGDKEFVHGTDGMVKAELEGFACVVCDCTPKRIEGKSKCVSINICHGITGAKACGADEKWAPWYDQGAMDQIDWAIVASRDDIPVAASEMGIPEDRILPLGMPRTDAYFDARETPRGEDGVRTYLYVPTFRYANDFWEDGWLPDLNWDDLDSALDDDEQLVVKRHYFTREPLVDRECKHIVEVEPTEITTPYLLGCDAVVTDYSSTMFDAYLCGKPVVLAIDDMRVYLEKRGMQHEYPGFYSSRSLSVERNEELLVEMLRDAADNGMGKVELECLHTVAGACDGNSTKRVVDLIKAEL